MSRCTIYLDESGDLGFNFTAPYRYGGSSRHITLSAVICPDDSAKHLKRFIKDFYLARNIAANEELKWARLSSSDCDDFSIKATQLKDKHQDICYHSITVYKPNVLPHIRADANKLYNYMAGLLLLPTMGKYGEVCFVPDARSIKVSSGNSLHDYLQTKLWFEQGVTTKLTTKALDSKNCKPLHFTDYLCGVFQSYYEDSHTGPWMNLCNHTETKRLFFPS